MCSYRDPTPMSRLAQLVERKTLNLVVVGSSPTVGVLFCAPTYFSLVSALSCKVGGPSHPETSSCGAVGSAWVS